MANSMKLLDLEENNKVKESSATSATQEALKKVLEENAKLKEENATSSTKQALNKALEENAKLKEESVTSSTKQELNKALEENAKLKEGVATSATHEALNKALEENAKLKEHSATSATREALNKALEENAKLKERSATSATREALDKALEENAKLRERSAASATREALDKALKENAKLKEGSATSATREALDKALKENAKLKERSATSATREALDKALEENAKLKERSATSATREALDKALKENAKLKERSATSATREALDKALKENAKLKEAGSVKSETRKRLEDAIEENERLKEQQSTATEIREAVKKLELDNLALTIRNRKKDIAVMMDQIRKTKMVEICFLVDSTGSMASCIDAVKTKINSVVNEVTLVHPDLKVRLAFVGYRDVQDGDLRFSVLDFVEDLSEFESFVGSVSATGGGDQCEDVFGGIAQALELDWKFPTRNIFHFADAPCHGTEFHDGCSDSYPDGDPEGLTIEPLLTQLQQNSIQYWFVHLNESTSKMIKVFKSKTSLEINELDMDYRFEKMVSTLSISICKSIMSVSKTIRPKGGRDIVFSGDHADTRVSKLILDTKYPESFITLDSKLYKYDPPKTKRDLYNPIKIYPGKDVIVEIAKRPFAEGASRLCYHGKTNDSKGTCQKIVLKQFKKEADNKNRKLYEEEIEISVASFLLAHEFNRRLSDVDKNISFLVPQMIEVQDSKKSLRHSTSFYWIEPLIEGEYKKFNNNFGYVSDDDYHQTLNAFSHWTYQYTEGYMMVVDLQGVIVGSEFRLTDPAIHCEDNTGTGSSGLERFGTTNFGKAGMEEFFKTHTCNKVCMSLDLRKKGRGKAHISTGTLSLRE